MTPATSTNVHNHVTSNSKEKKVVIGFVGGQCRMTGAPSGEVATFTVNNAELKEAATRIPRVPLPHVDASLVVKDNCLYLMGGHDGNQCSKGCLKFDPKLMSWSRIADMKHPRLSHTASVVGGYIIAAGGIGADCKRTASVEIYDVLKDEWTAGADMPQELSQSASCSHQGRFVLSGGTDRMNTEQNAVLEYDLSTSRWSHLGEMRNARSGHAVVSVNGQLYTLGGMQSRLVERLQNNRFHSIAELPVVKCSTNAVVRGDDVIMAGGWNNNDPVLTFNTRELTSTVTSMSERKILSPHVVQFEPKLLSLWVLSRRVITECLVQGTLGGHQDLTVFNKLPLPTAIVKRIVVENFALL